ncbi:MAG: PorT family protein [Pedobacter sp.]|nr:MAG: PorT family protein [Pedobacter sp.]
MKKMKWIGLSLALIGLGFSANAQSSMDTRVGIKAGANMFMMGKYEVGNTTFTSEYRPGFQAGLFLDLPLSEKLSFIPEVLYTQKGGKITGNLGNNTGEIRTTVGYIDVPVILSVNATPNFSVMAGAQASFLTNQETETFANGTSLATSSDTDDFRKSIAGGLVGFAYKFNPNLKLDARYNMDFQSIAKDNINQDKARFSGFSLSLGYSF